MSYPRGYGDAEERALSVAIGDRLPGHKVDIFDLGRCLGVAVQMQRDGATYRNGLLCALPIEDFDAATFADEASRFLGDWINLQAKFA